MFLIYTRRGALCAPVRWIWIYFMGIVPAPSGLGGGGNRVAVGVGAGTRRRRAILICPICSLARPEKEAKI